MVPPFTSAQRLLALPDVHRALLAEYDYFPEHDLLHVCWHGHLTAPAVVQGVQAGLALFANRPLPRRLLTNHRLATGEWDEAIPWLHYEWLPQVLAQGLQLLAHVVPTATLQMTDDTPGEPEFMLALQSDLLVKSFRCPLLAWHWATTR